MAAGKPTRLEKKYTKLETKQNKLKDARNPGKGVFGAGTTVTKMGSKSLRLTAKENKLRETSKSAKEKLMSSSNPKERNKLAVKSVKAGKAADATFQKRSTSVHKDSVKQSKAIKTLGVKMQKVAAKTYTKPVKK